MRYNPITTLFYFIIWIFDQIQNLLYRIVEPILNGIIWFWFSVIRKYERIVWMILILMFLLMMIRAIILQP